MRKIFLSIAILSTSFAFSQDVIVKKDGNTIVSKVVEVTPEYIKYKKFSNPQGPTYSVKIEDIASVNYENGDKDTFSEQPSPATSNITTASQPPVPDEQRNQELLALYKREYTAKNDLGSLKGSPARECIFVMGASSTSVFANNELEMSLVKRVSDIPKGEWGTQHVYYILLKNKTDRIIHIDRAQCYRLINGMSRSIYEDTKQVSVTRGSSSTVGIGAAIGGIGIGGASGSSASTTTSFQNMQYIEVPPHSMRYLAEDKWTYVSGRNNDRVYKKVESGEQFLFAPKFNPDNAYFKYSSLVKLKKGDIKKGEVKVYSEQDSPYTQEYIVTYSMDENFQNKNTLNAKFFLHQIGGVGTGYVNWLNFDGSYFEGFDEYSIRGYLRLW